MSVDVSSTAFNRATPWDEPRASEVALDASEATEFAAIVEETTARFPADFASGFISESPDKLRRLPRYYVALNNGTGFPETVCKAPWLSSVIEADGQVRPCFFHPSFGNIHDQPLQDILNSAQAIAFRRALDVKTDPICKVCVCTLSVGRRTSV